MSVIDLTTEELNQLLEEIQQKDLPKLKKPSGKIGENKDVLAFISETNVAPGEQKVPTYVIYYMYIKHCKQTVARKWGKTEFFRTFNKRFESKRSGNQRFYMINDAFKLTEELKNEAKEYEQKFQKKKPSK